MAPRTAVLSLVSFALLGGCVTSHHPVTPSKLGTGSRSAALVEALKTPGPIEVETISSADWKVDRSGLINLDSPRAQEAKLEDGLEPIQIYFHVLRHPEKGTFIIDTGVEKALRDAPDDAAITGIVASGAGLEHLKVRTALGDWLAKEERPLAGVLLTHLHLDHIMGLPDVPDATPIFLGPGETKPRALLNFLVNGTTDAELEGKGALNEWQFDKDPDGRFEGLIDVFGDGSLWAISVPGHTPGSTAYLARTPNGPVLFAGDTCHTTWGWEHEVEPGDFTADQEKNRDSLLRLRRFAAEHPGMQVRLGHQGH